MEDSTIPFGKNVFRLAEISLNTTTFISRRGVLLAGAALAGISCTVHAQSAVRLIVPFAPGSATDFVARAIAQRLQVSMNQSFVVDNRPGANGSIGALQAVQAPADGSTLLVASNPPLSSNMVLLKTMPYDPLRDLTYIAGLGESPLVLVTRTNFPASNLREALAYLRANASKLKGGYGTTSSKVALSMLVQRAAPGTLEVPYKGIPAAATDLMGGTLDLTFVDTGNASALAKGGRVKALAVTSKKRSPLAPDLPAMAEEIPGYDVGAWVALAGPKGLPDALVRKYSAAVHDIVSSPEFATSLLSGGLSPMPMTSADLRRFSEEEIAKWKQLASDFNIEKE